MSQCQTGQGAALCRVVLGTPSVLSLLLILFQNESREREGQLRVYMYVYVEVCVHIYIHVCQRAYVSVRSGIIMSEAPATERHDHVAGGDTFGACGGKCNVSPARSRSARLLQSLRAWPGLGGRRSLTFSQRFRPRWQRPRRTMCSPSRAVGLPVVGKS